MKKKNYINVIYTITAKLGHAAPEIWLSFPAGKVYKENVWYDFPEKKNMVKNSL